MRETRTVQALGVMWLALLVQPPAAAEAQEACLDIMLTRAAAAVPDLTPPAFVSLVTRGLASSRLASDATMPTISETGGPVFGPALVFDCSKRQYLDGGALRMDASRGFSVVALAFFELLASTTGIVRDVLFSFLSADMCTFFYFIRARNTNLSSVSFFEEEEDNNCAMQIQRNVQYNSWEMISVKLEVLPEELIV